MGQANGVMKTTWRQWFEVEDFETEDWIMTAGVVGIVLTMVFVLTR